ncbi:hypothetical protein NPIL_602271 [Nephila pilipes]|uniref:Uncharacterized protein n=1 Tax=Nephila pilipes TaxID=299642 RepID=A0A8X6NH41_NEPPI|nr:hypothetical protein NPIL_602271 [Nephila pilipes]
MDAFSASPSFTVMPIYLPEKADAMEHAVRQGMVKSLITYQEPKDKRIFFSFSSPTWFQKKPLLDNFKRTMMGVRVENQFDSDEKGRCRHGPPTTSIPVLIYELPPSSRKSRTEHILYQRSFQSYDQIRVDVVQSLTSTCSSLSSSTCGGISSSTNGRLS